MKNIKIIIAGGRKFMDYDLLCDTCDSMIKGRTNVEIVSGNAYGADRLGEEYAKDRGLSAKQFPADWNAHGKGAGMIRNKQMAEYADALIVFWDGESRGTYNMIETAQEMGLPIKVCMYAQEFREVSSMDYM